MTTDVRTRDLAQILLIPTARDITTMMMPQHLSQFDLLSVLKAELRLLPAWIVSTTVKTTDQSSLQDQTSTAQPHSKAQRLFTVNRHRYQASARTQFLTQYPHEIIYVQSKESTPTVMMSSAILRMTRL